jgi:uncharacterized protein (DUF697 family)
MFTQTEQRAVFAILLHAALADGIQNDAERATLRRMTESFAKSGEASFNPWTVYQEVLGGKLPLGAAARDLATREHRLLAFEMAVGVCDTDGPPNEREKSFLNELRTALQLPHEPAAAAAEAVAQSVAPNFAPNVPSATVSLPPRTPAPENAALEKSVLNYAILNGALELLPQSLSTMAVVPLQMKMVYAIGKAHGYTLDRGHIRDFLATAGAGLASQAVEGYARKLLGGLVGQMLGSGMMGGLGRAAVTTATGAGITFAATYAIGHLAIRYYGGGRKMEMAVLRDTYQRLLADGRSLFGVHRSEIERRAATLNPAEVINLVRQP